MAMTPESRMETPQAVSTAALRADAERYLFNNYGPRDLALVRGSGIHVWDAEGRRYADLLSGLGVNNLGHCHPRVAEALKQQAGTLMHVSNLYLIEPQIRLAKLLIENGPCARAFFCNSGAEANEAAFKMARKHSFLRHGEGRHVIVAMERSFHGRTMAALSATGQSKYHEGFQPLLPGFKHVPLNDAAALRAACGDTVCAVVIEPVQGEGGVYPADPAYLREARAVCDERDLLLIFDEVQCGLGRSGHVFASGEFGVEPDLIVLAKSLAGGAPIGALLAKEKPAAAFGPGSHAATFGGNPLCCAAAAAAFQTLLDENLAQRAKDVGGRFMARLAETAARVPIVREVRGRGLMIGVELDRPAAPAVAAMRERGYIVGTAGPNVVRFLPPLIIEESVLMDAAECLESILIAMRDAEG